MLRFLFVFMVMLPIVSSADAAMSSKEECELDVRMEYMMVKREDDPIFQELYFQEWSKAKGEYDVYINATSEPKKGSCTTGGQVYNYTCDGVSKNRDCIPEPCLKMHDRSDDETILEHDAKEKLIANMVKTRCGESGTPTHINKMETVESDSNPKMVQRTTPSVADKISARKAEKEQQEAAAAAALAQANKQVRDNCFGADKVLLEKDGHWLCCITGQEIKKKGGEYICQDTSETKKNKKQQEEAAAARTAAAELQAKRDSVAATCTGGDKQVLEKDGHVLCCNTGQEIKKKGGEYICQDTFETRQNAKKAEKAAAAKVGFEESTAKQACKGKEKTHKVLNLDGYFLCCENGYEIKEKMGKYSCQPTKETKDLQKDEEDEKKRIAKQAECDKKNPKQIAEKVMGVWQCVKTDETKELQKCKRENGDDAVLRTVDGKWECMDADAAAEFDAHAKCTKDHPGWILRMEQNEWKCMSQADADKADKAAAAAAKKACTDKKWEYKEVSTGKFECVNPWAEKITALNNDLETLKNALAARLGALAAVDKK